ncbi:sigma factor-like helix-turn-helix DNA-binding protein [Streptomyces sp. TRM49041]|uniref:sigma factor-like helix-turn-helix DNA-binding protein n=1 Tax=Streptomyces sp. TRM49041 TaxID=2603216 RepID=UPI0011EE2E7C|nr:sigma factor-like helix-turn-helix DNA-binding protein [Streptomyces sp. TRM49041]
MTQGTMSEARATATGPPEGAVREGAVPEGALHTALATPTEAFDALYVYAAPALVQQAYALSGRRRLAREAVEHAFHLAWDRWPEVAVDRDPAGWVRAATYEYALSPWHRLRPAHRHPDPPSGPEGPTRALREALLELPAPYRRTLLLFDGLGMGLPEVAAETEASTPAAGHRLLHARAALAERVPELAEPEPLRERLRELLTEGAATEPATPRTVRAGGERRVRLWTRGSIALSALIVAAIAFSLATAPTSYEPPLAPGEAVADVPVLSGPQKLTPEAKRLRARLTAEPVTGPPRLTPDAH